MQRFWNIEIDSPRNSWYNPRYIYFFRNQSKFFIFSLGEIIPTKNNKIAELPFLGKEYIVLFEMFINKITSHESILHIGLGANAEAYGDRNPAFFTDGRAGVQDLHIGSSVSGRNNNWANHPMELNKWIRVMVSQTLRDGKVRRKAKDNSKTEK